MGRFAFNTMVHTDSVQNWPTQCEGLQNCWKFEIKKSVHLICIKFEMIKGKGGPWSSVCKWNYIAVVDSSRAWYKGMRKFTHVNKGRKIELENHFRQIYQVISNGQHTSCPRSWQYRNERLCCMMFIGNCKQSTCTWLQPIGFMIYCGCINIDTWWKLYHTWNQVSN